MTPLFRRANDDAAFERLYQRHVKDVYRYTYAVLGERADAEDVTQTTFMNAYRAFQRGERPEKPENWLIAIAHNVCRQRFRQQQRRPSEVEYDDAIGGSADEATGPSAEDLRRAFTQLPTNQRAALVMRELEGRSYAEIAAVLEISVSALETLLFRARRALREQLEEQLTCNEAGLAISKQFDGRLSAAEQRSLRAHLRACPECASTAQRQRAQRRALRAILAVPLPQSLASFFGGAGAATGGAALAAGGTGVVLKAAAVLGAGALLGGGTYAGIKERPLLHHFRHRAPKAEVRPAVAPVSVVPAVHGRRATKAVEPRGHRGAGAKAKHAVKGGSQPRVKAAHAQGKPGPKLNPKPSHERKPEHVRSAATPALAARRNQPAAKLQQQARANPTRPVPVAHQPAVGNLHKEGRLGKGASKDVLPAE